MYAIGYIYRSIHTRIYTCACIYAWIQNHTHKHTCMRSYILLCKYVYTYLCMYICIDRKPRTRARTHIQPVLIVKSKTTRKATFASKGIYSFPTLFSAGESEGIFPAVVYQRIRNRPDSSPN